MDRSGAFLFHFPYEEREMEQDQELAFLLQLPQNQGEDTRPSHQGLGDQSMRE